MRKPYDTANLASRIEAVCAGGTADETRFRMSVDLYLFGRTFRVSAEKQQLLDLLVSSFEDLILMNRDLHARERDLMREPTPASAPARRHRGRAPATRRRRRGRS